MNDKNSIEKIGNVPFLVEDVVDNSDGPERTPSTENAVEKESKKMKWLKRNLTEFLYISTSSMIFYKSISRRENFEV